MSNYYNILEITNDATEEEIKKAYKKMAKKCHPDKNRENQEDATSKFKLISEAYQVLSDEAMREAYDRKRWMYDWNVKENTYSNSNVWKCFANPYEDISYDYSENNVLENFGFDTSFMFTNSDLYNGCMEDNLDPDTPMHSHSNTFENFYGEDKETNNEDQYDFSDEYNRSTLNTTNENKMMKIMTNTKKITLISSSVKILTLVCCKI